LLTYISAAESRQVWFTLQRGTDQFRCELVRRNEGWFAELFKNGAYDHRIGGPFEAKEEATEAAETERAAIDRGEMDGW
jgi:hypothetical protein